MVTDRDRRSGPDAVAEQARDITVWARRRGGEAGRLRLRQLEIILIVAVQCGLAAALSWLVAHEVLGRPAPVFAPSAAVGTIVAALGQRAKRTVELMFGVGLGLFTSDLLVLFIGFGPQPPWSGSPRRSGCCERRPGAASFRNRHAKWSWRPHAWLARPARGA
ncbi:hypothetical protein ACFY03_23215 [Micromonospora chersina]|uniref:hypothetical protein n=1 Tax=Micromonospora chersina TaxID=47854 RepID=UPI0036A6DB6C